MKLKTCKNLALQVYGMLYSYQFQHWSDSAKLHLPTIAAPKDALTPLLAARTAPVMAPLPIEFQGSSLSRIAMRAQSNEE